jgi:hypothetical protein
MLVLRSTSCLLSTLQLSAAVATIMFLVHPSFLLSMHACVAELLLEGCLCSSMAGRGPGRAPPAPRPPLLPPPAWIAATAERHAAARATPDPAAAAAARWTAAASAYARGGEALSRVPGTESMSAEAQAAACELAKLWRNLGLSPAAFEPTRHTMIIGGRPLQVPGADAWMRQEAPAENVTVEVCSSALCTQTGYGESFGWPAATRQWCQKDRRVRHL